MIRFEQVTKRYPGNIKAIDNLSFHIERGEMVFLAGHSGAGKSTLLELIAGIERASKGQVIVNGHNLSELRPTQLAYLRQHIGLVFQDHKILFDRSCFDNVMLPLEIVGFEHRDATRRVRAALDKVGLLDRANSNPVRLSGGEQQRLCIARAVVHRPAILLADEPTGNLDRAYAQDIMELFRDFHQVGVTVIVAAHDETLMTEYGQRTLRLNQGKLA